MSPPQFVVQLLGHPSGTLPDVRIPLGRRPYERRHLQPTLRSPSVGGGEALQMAEAEAEWM